MKIKYSKKHLRAIEKKLHNFELLFLDKKYFYKFEYYGFGEYLICLSVDNKCDNCILNRCDGLGSTYSNLKIVIDEYSKTKNFKLLLKYAKIRYKWIINKLNENGFDYK